MRQRREEEHRPRGWRAAAVLVTLAATAATAGAQDAPRIPVLVLTGQSEHDWQWSTTTLREVLEQSGKFHVEISPYPDYALADDYALSRYDLIVVDYEGPRWGDVAEANFLRAVEDGAGLLLLHSANRAFPDWPEYQALTGGLWQAGSGEQAFDALDVRVQESEVPATAGFPDLEGHKDALFHGLGPVPEERKVLARAPSEVYLGGTGASEPVALAGRHGQGRVFQTTLGHVAYGEADTRGSYLDDRFQRLLIRASEWAATGEVTALRRMEPNTLTAADRAAGWRLLFDGGSLEGWKTLDGKGLPEDEWRVENGCVVALTGEGGRDPMVAQETFQDFELELEWRLAEDADQRVLFGHGDGRTQGVHPDVLLDAVQVLRPAGEFNHARVLAMADHVEHWLNGIKILELDTSAADWAERVGEGVANDPELSRMPLGRIALQDHGVDVWFRNMKIRPVLPPEVARRTVEPVQLFNGRDLAGWETHWWIEGAIPPDVWTFDDRGVLHCKGLPIGYIATEQEFGDYVLELDYRFDPVTKQAGDGGIMLRLTESDLVSGQPVVWPKSLEVQLQQSQAGNLWIWEGFRTSARYPHLDGQVLVRSEEAVDWAGEWNHVEVHVVGDTVTLILNGRTVNVVPGAENYAGRIGIRSEGTPIQYRNVRLTPID